MRLETHLSRVKIHNPNIVRYSAINFNLVSFVKLHISMKIVTTIDSNVDCVVIVNSHVFGRFLRKDEGRPMI